MALQTHDDHSEARCRVNEQVLSARILFEIEAAKQVLRDWLTAHPDEQGMRDGFEQLYTIQEIIEDEDARRAAGEIIPPRPTERERILRQAAEARALPETQMPEMEWAAYELWDWLQRHPEDAAVRDALKALPLISEMSEVFAVPTVQDAEQMQAGRELAGAMN